MERKHDLNVSHTFKTALLDFGGLLCFDNPHLGLLSRHFLLFPSRTSSSDGTSFLDEQLGHHHHWRDVLSGGQCRYFSSNGADPRRRLTASSEHRVLHEASHRSPEETAADIENAQWNQQK